MHPLKYNYNGEMWDVRKIVAYGDRSESWARGKLRLVIDGMMRFEKLLEFSISEKKGNQKVEIAHDGDVWSVTKLAKLAGKSKFWAQMRFGLVKRGEKSIEEIVEEARASSELSKFVDIPVNSKYFFIGKPTLEYPEGKKYTVDEVMRVSGISREGAVYRIKKAIKYPTREKTILDPKDESKDFYSPKNEMTPRRREALKRLELATNHNQLLRG